MYISDFELVPKKETRHNSSNCSFDEGDLSGGLDSSSPGGFLRQDLENSSSAEKKEKSPPPPPASKPPGGQTAAATYALVKSKRPEDILDNEKVGLPIHPWNLYNYTKTGSKRTET